jgi:mevalonate kinase
MKCSDQNTAKRLQEILIFATKENPFFLLEGGKVKTYLEFNNLWGLGSSSTLIVNIASWAKINPYKLLNSSFGGSGYDVACGLADGPIFYSKKQSNPKVESIFLSPIFFEKLYFVYLNQKVDSQKAVRDFDLNKVNTRIIKKLDNLTEEMSSTYDINKFKNAMEEHEKIIGSMIKKRPIKDVLFSNFTGSIKSLGAWGGDFILVTENEDRDTEKYFKKMGYNTVIPWKEMSLVH